MSLFRKKREKVQNSLLLEIADTKRALDAAYSVFENVIDKDLIDSSIYQVNAIQERYKFLLKQAKEEDRISSLI